MDDTTPTSDVAASGDLMRVFAELTSLTAITEQPEEVLRRIVTLAKQNLGGVQDVSLTVIEDQQPRTVVSTGPVGIELDQRQYELGFGPCLDAARTGQILTVDHDSPDTPYQEHARVAQDAGVRRTVSVGLPLTQRWVGGLNFYTTDDDSSSPSFHQGAEMFAGFIGIVLNSPPRTSTNQPVDVGAAMQSWAAIEQAKGILMAQHHATADEAAELLDRIAQSRNITLHDAARLVATSSTE